MTLIPMEFSNWFRLHQTKVKYFISNQEGMVFQVMLYHIPHLKGISHLSSLRNKGKTKLLILSADEGVLGVSEYKKGKGFSFPLMVEMEGIPIAAVPAHSGKEKDDKLIVLCELESDFYLKDI